MASNNTYQLDPGPLDPSVLTEQLTHRSRDIWIGNDNMILNTRKCDGKYDDPYLIWFRRITCFVIGNPISRPQQLQGYVPNATAYETMLIDEFWKAQMRHRPSLIIAM
ncbi:hypothetical protein H5410_019721 [Solanum commersonii]|uniref:Uncharacterized protein n=1 Tax=Solanum commersonii TaxID=4109 RepID=A0A9J5Z946_SOLCO|nr:hypothetical protein H5410_019721 [Solanum commersonii]